MKLITEIAEALARKLSWELADVLINISVPPRPEMGILRSLVFV